METRRNAETTAEAAALPCPGQRRHGRARAPKCRAGPRAQGAFLSSLFCAFQALARGAACGGGEANAGHAGADAGAASVALKSESRPFSAFLFPVPSGGAATPGFATSLHHASQPLTAHQAVSVSRVAAGDVGTAGGAAQGLQPAPGSGSTRFFAFVCFTQARKHVAFIHLLTEVASPSAVLALVVSSPSRYSIFPFLPLSLKLSLSLSLFLLLVGFWFWSGCAPDRRLLRASRSWLTPKRSSSAWAWPGALKS